jgi:hypothetical protein
MAEEAGAGASSAAVAAASGDGKMTMVVGVDESEHSYYALQWTLLHFFSPGQLQQYRLVVVTAKPTAASAVGLAGPGACAPLFTAFPNWGLIGFYRSFTDNYRSIFTRGCGCAAVRGGGPEEELDACH